MARHAGGSFGLAVVGLSTRAMHRLGPRGTDAFAQALLPVARRVAKDLDPASQVGQLFPGHSDLFVFVSPDLADAFLDCIRHVVTEPLAGSKLSVFGLTRTDLRLAWERVRLPLSMPAKRAFNLVAHRLALRSDRCHRRSAAVRRLERILDTCDLGVALQPIVSLTDGTVHGYEAHVRGPAASRREDVGWLVQAALEAGRWESLEDLWRRVIVRHVRGRRWTGLLFVGIHPRRGVAELLESLGAVGVATERVVLEVNEQTVRHHEAEMQALLAACRRAGAALALDDVGTGYPGWAVLALYPWDYLKIDRTLVKRAQSDPRHRALLSAIADYAARTGAKTVGEGIEEENQAHVCRASGISLGQGCFFGEPVGVDRRA